jgi:hypothetical protein
MKKDEL